MREKVDPQLLAEVTIDIFAVARVQTPLLLNSALIPSRLNLLPSLDLLFPDKVA